MLLDAFIGGIGGAVSRTCVAPMELYRIQRQNYFIPNATLSDVYKKEGLRYFWKGNGVNCARIFPQLAINYAVFRKTKSILETSVQNKNIVNFIAGSTAGSICMLTTYPLETTRSYFSLQTNKNKYKGIIDTIKKVKIRQYYQGIQMSLWGMGMWSGIQYSLYYYVNRLTKGTYFDSKLVSGALSGCLGITITYPTDLIRRRLQLQGFDKSVPKYNGILDAVKRIYYSEGMRGFYRGLGASYLKTAPTVAIQFWTIEKLNYYLKNEDI